MKTKQTISSTDHHNYDPINSGIDLAIRLWELEQRTVLTIHDCRMIHRSKGLKRWLLLIFWMRIPVLRAGVIVVLSDKTRQDIQKYPDGEWDGFKRFSNVVELVLGQVRP